MDSNKLLKDKKLHWPIRMGKGEEDIKDQNIPLLIGISGLCIILISVIFLGIFENIKPEEFPKLIPEPYARGLFHFIRDVGIAVLTAGIIAATIELPTFVEFIRDNMINVLTSYSYLYRLTEEGLLNLKKACNDVLIEKKNDAIGDKENYLNSSLINLESSFSDYFYLPFYEYHKMYVQCEEVRLNDILEFKYLTGETKAIRKSIVREFRIINPRVTPAIEQISLAYLSFTPHSITNKKELCKVKRFTYMADREGEKDITSQVFFEEDKQFLQKYPSEYDTRMVMRTKDGSPLALKYDNELHIRIEEERYVFFDDSIFTFTLSKPSKNTTLNYVYTSRNNSLNGAVFGTKLGEDDDKRVMMTRNRNSIQIETFQWLLPGNGFIIVHLPDKENQKEREF